MALEVEIFAKNMEVNERLNDYVTKKVSKLDRFLNGIEQTRVDLAFEKAARSSADRQVAQITIWGKGFILRTEERADDIFAAVDTALDKMQRQIERLKGKRHRGRGDGTPASAVTQELLETEEENEAEEAPIIARRKQFVLTPMDELEAIEQMRLLGHDNFFVFYNANNNMINVLYRRRDGSYGLIEPSVG
jgi:putative sigma-54 modulation protein